MRKTGQVITMIQMGIAAFGNNQFQNEHEEVVLWSI